MIGCGCPGTYVRLLASSSLWRYSYVDMVCGWLGFDLDGLRYSEYLDRISLLILAVFAYNKSDPYANLKMISLRGQSACLNSCFGSCRQGVCQFAWPEGVYLAALLLSAVLITINVSVPLRAHSVHIGH